MSTFTSDPKSSNFSQENEIESVNLLFSLWVFPVLIHAYDTKVIFFIKVLVIWITIKQYL